LRAAVGKINRQTVAMYKINPKENHYVDVSFRLSDKTLFPFRVYICSQNKRWENAFIIFRWLSVRD